MRTITLEEHWATPAYMDGPGRFLRTRAGAANPRFAGVPERLVDLGERRLGEMDEAGIDVQVLSLNSPGVEQMDPAEAVAVARETNDALGDAVRRHPDHLAGFAAVPTPSPEAAGDELERAVRDLGFKGAIVNGHVRGRYLDEPGFRPLLARADALGVPIYLHPTLPPAPVQETYYAAGLPPAIASMFGMAAWGWHIETAVHVLRLILAGVFDRYPRLQVVIGHLGEGLPMLQDRLDDTLPPAATGLDRSVATYLRENVHYTISGFNYVEPFKLLLAQVGVPRIMFSADYPYASMQAARVFLDSLPVSIEDRERIAHTNAERLLGM